MIFEYDENKSSTNKLNTILTFKKLKSYGMIHTLLKYHLSKMKMKKGF